MPSPDSGPLLSVDALCASLAVPGTQLNCEAVIDGLDLTVGRGEVHAILAPGGAGTSMLGAALMGSPRCAVTAGTITFRGDDVTDWPVVERAKAGMFLAFRDPCELAGVSTVQLLHQALSTRRQRDLSILELRRATTEWMRRLDMEPSLVDHSGLDGVSLAERKCSEILQMAILEPELALFDETDPGLDIESIGTIARGIRVVRTDRPATSIVLTTHDHRLVVEMSPDIVHILVGGRIVDSGGIELAERLARTGDDGYRADLASRPVAPAMV